MHGSGSVGREIPRAFESKRPGWERVWGGNAVSFEGEGNAAKRTRGFVRRAVDIADTREGNIDWNWRAWWAKFSSPKWAHGLAKRALGNTRCLLRAYRLGESIEKIVLGKWAVDTRA